MTTYLLELPYRRPPLNENDRMHWAPANKWKQQIKSDTRILCVAGKVPRGMGRIRCVLHYTPMTIRRRDDHNMTPTLKAAVDGIVQAKVVEDDSVEFVESWCHVDPVAAKPRVYLVITDLTAEIPPDSA